MTDERFTERGIPVPADKPRGERGDHGNLERPGAQARPRCHARPRPWAGPRPWGHG